MDKTKDRKDDSKGGLKDEEKIEIANLDYSDIGDISCVSQRTWRKLYAGSQTYSQGQTITVDFPIGSDMVFGPTSYMVLTLTAIATGSTLVHFGRGSVMNIFESMLLQKGEEIERVDNLNLLSYYKDKYMNSQDSLQRKGQVMGYTIEGKESKLDLKTAKTFCIPLSKIGGFFGHQTQLIPSFHLAGARLSLKLAGGDVAFVMTGAPNDYKYTVSNVEVVLDTFKLVDPAKKHLTKQASKENGLVFNFTTWGNQQSRVSAGTTNLSANVGKPIAHAVKAFTTVRQERDAAADAKVDSFQSIYLLDDAKHKWRYILGSTVYPEAGYVETVQESYMYAMNTFDQLTKEQDLMKTLSYHEFRGTDDEAAATTERAGVFGMSFNRLHNTDLSGVPLNQGSRSMYLNWSAGTAVKGTADGTGGNIDVVMDTFLNYVVCAQAFSNGNVVVRF